MKLSEAKEICPDVRFVKDEEGKTRCKHKRGDFCTIPNTTRFMCVFEELKYANAARISHSSAGMFIKCPRFYRFNKIDKIDEFYLRPSWAILGSIFHDNMERLIKGEKKYVPTDPPAGYSVTEFELAALDAVVDWWFAHPENLPQIDEVEVEFKFMHASSGVMITGRIDGIDHGRGVLVEHKYAATSYDWLSVKRQLGIYFAAFPDTDHCIIVQTMKPTIRLKKNETLDEWRSRCVAWVEDAAAKGELIRRSEYSRREFDIGAVLNEVVAVRKMINLCTELDTWPGVYSSFTCAQCEVVDFCKRINP